MGGMGTPRRGKIARTMLIWTVMAVIAATVAGCTQVVHGRAVLAEPKVGQPVEWGPCRISGGGTVKLPGGARAAGRAMAACPSGQGIPWHRVVGAGGRLLLREPNASLQRKLLESEGLRLAEKRILDFSSHQWNPRKTPRRA